MNVKYLLFFGALTVLLTTCNQNYADKSRLSRTINSDWTFNYFPDEELDSNWVQKEVDDSEWTAIALPHTWQTYETTRELHPFIKNAAETDDPYWWYGWGIYRKTFQLNKKLSEKKVFIELDGVQKYSRVYLNGKFIGDHKGGFTSFYFDLTKHMDYEKENVLTVAVNNRRNDQFHTPPMTAGNWNVYGGIYRDVRLVVKERLYIPYQGSYKHEGGTFITTPKVNAQKANVQIQSFVKNEYDSKKEFTLISEILDAQGQKVAEVTTKSVLQPNELGKVIQSTEVNNPKLWHPDDPNVYQVVSSVILDGNKTDQLESPLGFRWFHWDYEKDDLYINGKRMNILGTNRHQEYPWLGDAHPKWIAKMDMEDIKNNLGHNFMRLTHYPNDKYLYQLADTLGIAMVEEVPNIKDIDFDEEIQEQNVREMIRRDRNHPSILFWSVGNETSDAADSKWAYEEDTTRIIHLRKGQDGGEFVDHTHRNLDMEQLLRVTIHGWFDEDDVPEGVNAYPDNGQHSSSETWQHQMARKREGSVRGILGRNSNTWLYEDHGADREYLNCTLLHINPKGWVDMYRQPKYVYHLTKAYFTENPTVFIHPHFWRKQYIGTEQDIVIDANLDKVELFINDESHGVEYPKSGNFNTLTFEGVTVTQGVIKAVGIKDDETYEHEIHLPGQPARLTLAASHEQILADRSGIAIVTAHILDEEGHPVFDATNTLKWKVEGPGKLVGAEVYESDINKHEAMEGTGYTVVPVSNVVRSTRQSGEITVTVTSEGLAPASITISCIDKPIDDTWLAENTLSDQGRTAVTRDPAYTFDEFVPEEIFTIRGNMYFEGNSYESYHRSIDDYLDEFNRGLNTSNSGYVVLLDVLANKLVNGQGELIADDFNFIRSQYNRFRVLDKAIDELSISDGQKRKIAAEYAHRIIRKAEPLDVFEEAKELLSNEGDPIKK